MKQYINRLSSFLFTNKTIRQTVTKNTVWLLVGEIGVRVCKLALFVYAARILSTDEWGTFSYVLALMSVFAVISDIGINNVLIRESTRNKKSADYLATGFVLKIFLSIVAAISLLLVVTVHHYEQATRALIPPMSLVLLFDSMREFGYSINRAGEKMETEAFGKIIYGIALFGIGVVCISRAPSGYAVAIAYLLAGIVSMGLLWFTLQKSDLSLRHYTKKLLRPILREAWPLAIISAFGIVLTNIDTIILGWYRDSATVGLYAVAQKPYQLLYILPIIAGIALLPTFSRFAQHEPTQFTNIVHRALKTSFIIGTSFAVVAIALSRPGILLLFGKTYTASIEAFMVLVASIAISAPGIVAANALFAMGKQRRTALAIVGGALLNIALCIILIPLYGLIGAAISGAIAQVVANIWILISVCQFLRHS